MCDVRYRSQQAMARMGWYSSLFLADLAQPRGEPCGEGLLGERAGGEGEHRLEHICHLRVDIVAIEVEERRGEQPSSAFVAVDERMVPQYPARIACGQRRNVRCAV